METPANIPLAYFITCTTYGTWLHGDERGSVSKHTSGFKAPLLEPDPILAAAARRKLVESPLSLDESHRRTVLTAMTQVYRFRHWRLHAIQVRTKHAHAVISAPCQPEKIWADLKAYATRALREAGLRRDRFWTENGSARWLWRSDAVTAAVQYVLLEQGPPMAVGGEAAEYFFPRPARSPGAGTFHSPKVAAGD